MNQFQFLFFEFLSLYQKQREIEILNLKKDKSFIDCTYQEIKCLEIIKSLNYPNCTEISKVCNVSKSYVCKITKQLLNKNYITYKYDRNNKEKLYIISNYGEKILLMNNFELFNEYKCVFEKFSSRDIEIISSLLLDINSIYSNHMRKLYN